MQLLIGFILLALAVPIAHAESLEIVSPSHAYTFAHGDAVSHQIEHDQFTNEMIARVTFSNYPFGRRLRPSARRSVRFRFSRSAFRCDTKGIFRARVGSHAASNCGIASEFSVCRLQARADREIFLVKRSGHVTAVLKAAAQPVGGARWLQVDDNWSLQNLLALGLERLTP